MNHDEIITQLESNSYKFLTDNPRLGKQLMIIGLGGSHAYGTDIATSDLDIRGCALRSGRDILTGYDWEQVVNNDTDTTIYSFDKLVKLLTSCNPNTIELLGLKKEHYLYVSPEGEMLINNAELFLSKQALHSFGGYALAQLNRLNNKSGRAAEQIVANETRSLQKAVASLVRDGVIHDISVSEKDGKPMIAINDNISIDDFTKVSQVIDNVHTDYRSSTRNRNAIEHDKLAKHQMHLIRLYMMAYDILDKGEIITYREKEHDFLMDVRNGKYLTDNKQPTKEFMEYVKEMEQKVQDAAKRSCLPDYPNKEAIRDLVFAINSMSIETMRLSVTSLALMREEERQLTFDDSLDRTDY